MNKIYRLVWSRKEQALVVASEFAKSDSVGKTVKVGRAGSLVLAGAVTLLSVGTAAAGSLDGGTATGAHNAIAIGQEANAPGDAAIAIGTIGTFDATTVASGTDSIAIGNGARATRQADTSLGVTALATGGFSTALGAGAESEAFESVAVGRDAEAQAVRSLALGTRATAGQTGAVALGDGSVTAAAVGTTSGTIAGTTYRYAGTTPTSTVSIGTAGSERTITNVAAGRVSATSTDAINGSQLSATNTEVTALDARVDKQGTDTAANLGGGSTYDATTGAVTAPSYNINNSTYNNVGDALNAIVNDGKGIKYFRANSTLADASATGTDSVAVGPQAVSSATNAVAVGNGAQAGQAGAVALGAGSTTAAAVGTASGTIAGTTYNYAGATPASTVSVGAAGAERTVTNVAAGRVSATSTDAVNGSQLNATNTELTNLDGRVDNIGKTVADNFGGGSTYDPTTGTVSAPTYNVGGNTYNNVGDALTNVDGRVTTNTTNITNLTNQITNGTIGLVQQDPTSREITVGKDTDGTVINVAGTAGDRKITGVADGAVTTTSTEAINGSQLQAVSQSVADNLGGGSVVNPDGTVSAPTYNIGGNTYNNVGDALTNVDGRVTNVEGAITNINNGGGIKYFHANSTLVDSTATGTDSIAVGPVANASATNAVAVGNGAVADQAGSVALGAGSKTAAAVATASGTVGGVTRNFAGATPTSTVSVGDVGAERTVTNVAAGRISATSTDAVNGSQLFATNQQVDANTTNLTNLTTNISNGTIGLVQQDPTSREITVGKDTDGTVINVAGTAGDRKITGVADGAVTTTSTEAINGSQLQAVSQSVADNLGGGSVVNPDGTVSAPTYNIGGNTYHNVGDALTNVDGRVTNVEGAITTINNGGGIKYFHANSTLVDSTATGTDSIAVGPKANASAQDAVAVGNGAQATHANSVALGAGSQTTVGAQSGYEGAFVGASSSTGEVAVGGRKLTGVAAGSEDTDAVNVSQLKAGVASAVSQANTYTDNRINEVSGNVSNVVTEVNNLQNGADGVFQVSQDNNAKPTVVGPNSTAGGGNAQATAANSTALGANTQASGSNSVALGAGSIADRDNTVSVGREGQERQIANVAAGSRDTDAVNVGQLRQSTAGTVRYDTNSDGSVNQQSLTLNQGGAPVGVHNVADGVRPNDAVNVGQLNRAVDGLRSDQFDLRRESRGGTASAMAMAGLPQATDAGRHMLAAGIGGYEGEVGVAVGLSGVTDNGRYIYKANISTNTTKDFGFSVGAGIQW